MCNIKFFGMLWMPNYAEHEDGSLMLLNISNIKRKNSMKRVENDREAKSFRSKYSDQ